MRAFDIRALIEELRAALGEVGVISGAESAVRAVGGWSRLGTPLLVARPADTQQVSAAMRICAAHGVPVVAWGGKTGLVDGAFADDAVALSLERMTRIESLDVADGIMTVQAGCALQTVCEAAEGEDLFFPLDLGARGSATIGGTISTNAGGNRVVRFGMMRELVLGLEAVLADGTIISSLYPFIKNNTGYDLKQLFIGSEGTLGIVTRAVLRLRKRLSTQNVAIAAVDGFERVIAVLRRLESLLGGQLSAFEVMWSDFYRLVTTAPAKGAPILPHGYEFYILIEALGGNEPRDAENFQEALGALLEDGSIRDAAVARSVADVNAMWALRDDGAQVQREGPIASFDVSLQLSRIGQFEKRLRAILAEGWPATRLILFGHVGDGNIHIVVTGIDGADDARRRLATGVYRTLKEFGGSISAEHGIGLDKRPYLALSRTPAEMELMRRLKVALDPQNLLNPGKILAAVDSELSSRRGDPISVS